MVVLEGCDGAGKTTLARAIAAQIGAEWREHDGYTAVPDPDGPPTQIIHRGPPARHPLEECVLDLDGYRPGAGRHLVLDRLHWGEPIYGELYRGASLLGEPGLRWIDLYLASRGAVQVHVTAVLSVIQARLRATGETYLRPEHVAHVWRAYHDLAERRLEPLTACTDLYETDALARMVLVVARWLERGVAHVATDRWIGSAHPHTLLVGEETSPRHLRGERPSYRAPFAPYRDSSGWYLLGALPDPWWRGVALCNAREVDVPALAEALDSPAVVALGGAASEALLPDLAHARVPHPQWVRRFAHSRLLEYGQLLVDVAGTERKVATL